MAYHFRSSSLNLALRAIVPIPPEAVKAHFGVVGLSFFPLYVDFEILERALHITPVLQNY